MGGPSHPHEGQPPPPPPPPPPLTSIGDWPPSGAPDVAESSAPLAMAMRIAVDPAARAAAIALTSEDARATRFSVFATSADGATMSPPGGGGGGGGDVMGPPSA